jgi:hypothetical protein
MEISSDFKELLLAFNEEAAKYLVIEALAVGFHGYPRATADFDVLVEPSQDNARRVYRALTKFGAPLHDLKEDDLTRGDLVFMIGVVPHRIDVLTSISGVDFNAAWEHRVAGQIEGVPANFIGFDDLVANKVAAGRDKDMVDVRRLRQMRER